MAKPDSSRNFNAGADIVAYTIVKPGASNDKVVPAAAASDALIGVVSIDVKSGYRVDVIQNGVAFVKSGGTIAEGDPITSNASGQAVKAAPAAGTNNRIIGIAMTDAVSGDVFPAFLSVGYMQG
jgi:hypothetical protein